MCLILCILNKSIQYNLIKQGFSHHLQYYLSLTFFSKNTVIEAVNMIYG